MRFQMSVSSEMAKALEAEKRAKRFGTIQETIRSILAEYFAKKAK